MRIVFVGKNKCKFTPKEVVVQLSFARICTVLLLCFVVLFVFNVPPTAKVIWRRGHGLKSHPTDW